jgi:acyl-CoA synthetase
MGAHRAHTTVNPHPPAIRVDDHDAARYRAEGWWTERSLSEDVGAARTRHPAAPAFATADGRMSWARYDDLATRLAAALAGAGLERGARLAVLLPDGPTAHVTYLAAERAGLAVVGIAARSGEREIAHLLRLGEADALVTHADLRDEPSTALAGRLAARHEPAGLRHLVVPDLAHAEPEDVTIDGRPPAIPSLAEAGALVAERRLSPDELYLLNSTSGTTGLPKCVAHTQQAWLYAARLAIAHGELTSDDVVLSAVPTPYGFGLWSAHIAPALLGAPTVLLERFDADAMLDLIERERVTVLAAVTTQLTMALRAAEERPRDLRSLRVVFTGGEAVPTARAAAFERLSGARVLQFYGSNETGVISGTTIADPDDKRLTSAGRVVGGMDARLLRDGHDGTAERGSGRLACRGPSLSLGYQRDEAANAQLLTADGWMLTGDLVEIDDAGYLHVVGRAADLIIRGGKNVSAPAVEAEVATHPAVAQAAAVAMPDPVFGERVCVYAVLRPGAALGLAGLVAHLEARGVTREWLPERLVVVERLPMSAGGKVAKAELREDIRQRIAVQSGGGER